MTIVIWKLFETKKLKCILSWVDKLHISFKHTGSIHRYSVCIHPYDIYISECMTGLKYSQRIAQIVCHASKIDEDLVGACRCSGLQIKCFSFNYLLLSTRIVILGLALIHILQVKS